MARVNRREVLSDGEIQVVHCVNRCVRSGFLCGVDEPDIVAGNTDSVHPWPTGQDFASRLACRPRVKRSNQESASVYGSESHSFNRIVRYVAGVSSMAVSLATPSEFPNANRLSPPSITKLPGGGKIF